jgi:lipoprotein-anchoring transpeptidase ErfK/SrfK
MVKTRGDPQFCQVPLATGKAAARTPGSRARVPRTVLAFLTGNVHRTMRIAMGRNGLPLLLVMAGVLLVGCAPDDGTDRDADRTFDQVQPTTDTDPARDQGDGMEIEVDLDARELHVRRDGRIAETHSVAVGSEEWPTRTGDWTIDEVVLNPRWVPPDEEWAEDEDEIEAGDPDNPLGVAQLVYDRPRSVHGTNEPGSIGQAVSHGSIRVTNEVARQLARQVMEAGGVADGDERLRRAEEDPETSQTVRLTRGIPIRVVSGNR